MLLVLIIIGLGLLATQKLWVGNVVNFILKYDKTKTVKNDPLNITYNVAGKYFRLVNGKAEKDNVAVFGQPVYGDLNGDGVSDAVMYLTENSGGSGTFFYVVEAINKGGVYKGTNAMFVGDRIAPQNIEIQKGVAVVNYADRNPGESFAVQPSLGKSIWVHLDEKNMEIGELVQGYETR